MLVIRTAKLEDLDPLFELIGQSEYGLTTLKISKDQLHERLEESHFAFQRKPKRPSGQPYVFIMEDLDSGAIVGTSSIYSKVGGFEPFYGYHVERLIRSSEQLQITKEVKILHLMKEHNGPTEIGSLYLSPGYRGSGNGRLLSLSRFLFMAGFPDRFDKQVIAEMRGRVDENGRSPFWEAIGHHFFELEFPKAEMLTTVSKNFIADLMPEHPIYVSLLPIEAQETIGRVHRYTEPALAMLQKEGFEHRDMIDIFDGGPVIHCATRQVRAVRESRLGTVVSIENDLEGEPMLIANGLEAGFRCTLGPIETDKSPDSSAPWQVRISRVTALGLGVKVKDSVRFVELKPSDSQPSNSRQGAHHE